MRAPRSITLRAPFFLSFALNTILILRTFWDHFAIFISTFLKKNICSSLSERQAALAPGWSLGAFMVICRMYITMPKKKTIHIAPHADPKPDLAQARCICL